MLPDSAAIQYHTDFSEEIPRTDVAVTLVSRDKMRFRVRGSVLKAASGVFETTLSLPQAEGDAHGDAVIDNLDEDAATIEGLLRMITAQGLPPLDTIDAIEPLVFAAEKWDMPGPLSILRRILRMDLSIVSKDPMSLYLLGCRLKWTDISDLASTYTRNADILYQPELMPVLKALDSEDLLRLMKFHRGRRDYLQVIFDGPEYRRLICMHRSHYFDLRSRCLTFIDQNPPARPPSEAILRDMIQRLVGVEGCHSYDCSAVDLDRLGDHIAPLLLAQWEGLPQNISKFEVSQL